MSKHNHSPFPSEWELGWINIANVKVGYSGFGQTGCRGIRWWRHKFWPAQSYQTVTVKRTGPGSRAIASTLRAMPACDPEAGPAVLWSKNSGPYVRPHAKRETRACFCVSHVDRWPWTDNDARGGWVNAVEDACVLGNGWAGKLRKHLSRCGVGSVCEAEYPDTGVLPSI